MKGGLLRITKRESSKPWPLLVLGALLIAPVAVAGAAVDPHAVQSLLEKKCLSCHGPAQMSGLDLRQREAALRGGKRGPAIHPGDASGSLLYQFLGPEGEVQMPPGNDKLSAEEIALVRDWISGGAPWWDAEPAEAAKASQPSWWSFRKPERPALPAVKTSERIRTPIDAFVFSKLEEKGLKPAPEADKRTLIRRAYHDLTGLPPSPGQVEAFVADDAPDAYERLVDSLLESPRYGERWGRHWLDVVRYADSGGYETDIYYRNAWRYRDYVVDSWNKDKPYDRFVQEQIAGDEIWPDNLDLHGTYQMDPKKLEHLEARVGTTFYHIGPEMHEANMDAALLRNDKYTDWADTVGAAFLGLTVRCARCHDHKFDPISQRDYYRMQAIFSYSESQDVPIVHKMGIRDRHQFYPRILVVTEARKAYSLFEKHARARIVRDIKQKFSPEVLAAYEIPQNERTPPQKELAGPLLDALQSYKLDDELTADEKDQQQKLQAAIAKAVLDLPLKDAQNAPYDGLMETPTVTVMGHTDPALVEKVRILNRGELDRPEDEVGPGVLSVLAGGLKFDPPRSDREIPLWRKQLALWLTDPDNPLTARVMVNRIWYWHFGRGIVDTPNDFGKQGLPPSHPELLDWLAREFMENGWSMKHLHRLLMNSSVYRMSSSFTDGRNVLEDPDNEYLWRMNRRRLEGESLWDAMHAVAGTLNLAMGGPPVNPELTTEESTAAGGSMMWPTSADPQQHYRRGVYLMVRRNFVYPMFEAFDSPDTSVSCAGRDVTTVTPQALWSLNNERAYGQAQAFADRLIHEQGGQPGQWIDRAWNVALGRPPTGQERREALHLLDALVQRAGLQESETPSELPRVSPALRAALTKLCLSIFNLNEFAYID